MKKGTENEIKNKKYKGTVGIRTKFIKIFIIIKLTYIHSLLTQYSKNQISLYLKHK